MTCLNCTHYQSSEDAHKPRAGLDGYGYCKAAPSIELRARIFTDRTPKCWLADDCYAPLRMAPRGQP